MLGLLKKSKAACSFLDNQIEIHPIIFKALFGIGSLYLLKQLVSVLPARLYKFNMAQRYGLGSWAVVTGGSDGIGKAFCHALAKEGFNIAIVSRTLSKMNEVTKELQAKYGVLTKVVVADFKDGGNVEFYQNIYEHLKDLDVSILVNNVGHGTLVGVFQDLKDQDVLDQLTINAPSTMFMTKILFDQLLNRKNGKSAVITISSVTADYPSPYGTIYSCTKAFQDYFSQSLMPEFGHQIDFLSVKPGGVSTDMLKKVSGRFIITPEECAQASLNELRSGKFSSYGHDTHKAQVLIRFMGNEQKQREAQIAMGKYFQKLHPQE